MIDSYPFWYNPNNISEEERKDSSKNEIQDDENDEAVTISLQLEVIPTPFAKLAYLGTEILPKLNKC